MGMLLCSAGPKVVRIVPPLTISDDDLEQGLSIISEILQ
jgi:4-aminobutyrate aminotransferase-like enzyme